MNSNWHRLLLPPLALLLAAIGLRPLESDRGAGNDIAPTPWQMLGGMRSLVADMLWLRTNLAWERRDAVATRMLLDLTVAADPRPLTYWFNGARMIAFDLPEWAADPAAPVAVREARRREAAVTALAFLDRARVAHPADARIAIEIANLHLRATGDRAAAARWFRVAALLPDAPPYAARVHAELLCELGRTAEALAWLRSILPRLAPDNPAQRRAVVEQRIKALEATLAHP